MTSPINPANSNGTPQIEIQFKSHDRRYATCLRHFIATYASLKLERTGAEVPFNVAMISNELIQNAIQYSKDQSLGFVKVEFEEKHVHITVRNIPQADHLRDLEDILKKIHQSALDFYLFQVQNSDNAKLGLVRIANDFASKIHQSRKGDYLVLRVSYPL